MRKLITSNLKFSLSLLLFTFIAFTTGTAQELSMSDVILTYDKETRPAIQIILEPEPDAVKKAWEDYLKDKYDVKLKGTGLFSNKDILSAEEVTVTSISPNAMNFHTRIVEKGLNTEMSVLVSFGYDLYVDEDKYPAEYAQLKKMTQEFLNTYLPAYYQEQLEKVQKTFGKLDKDRSKLEEKMTDNTQKIKKLTKENEEMAAELAATKEKLTTTSNTLEERKEKTKGIVRKLKWIN